jgi:thymidine phosphorylase
LGNTIGNALELAEAVDVLRGRGPEDVTELCLHEAATLLAMARLVASEAEGHERAQQAIADGSALAKLAEVVAAQGGDAHQIEDTSLLPQAPYREEVPAPRDGYITAIDAERLGLASVRLGAGRARKGDPIDHSVGLVLHAKVGAAVERGRPLLQVHARSQDEARAIHEELLAAYTWGDEPPPRRPMMLGSVSGRGA